MIRKVKFSNFYSFSKEQEISFLAKKKKTYDYYYSDSGDQISKVAAFIGGNASGKTNVMRLFSFLGFFVSRKIEDDSSLLSKIAYQTFFNNEKESKFYIEFEIDKFIFYYNFSIIKKENKVLEEKLELREIKKGARSKIIFQRNNNNLKVLNKDFFKNINIKSLARIREDLSFISFIKFSQYKVAIIDKVYDYFSSFRSNLNELGENLIYNPSFQANVLESYLRDSDIREKAEEIICNFDLGLSGFEIKRLTQKNKLSFLTIKGVHNSKMENSKLDFIYESSGTRSLFFALANILNALKYGTVVIVDEIESGLHPEALNKIINYFINTNEKGRAQLIFSSHSLDFMKRFDRQQIFLVEKSDWGETEVLGLNELKEPKRPLRSDENFLSKYLSGVYGAFPKIRI